MYNPKTFYRELDTLLAKISKDISGKNLLASVFNELEQNFSQELNIANGAIYEKRTKDFMLIYSSSSNHWIKSLSIDNPAIQQVLKNGSYIYDKNELASQFGLSTDYGYILPAAISIHSPERHWLMLFGLKDNWVREEINLFLNAVRTALNYRLFSDIIGGELQQAVQIQKSLLPRSTPKVDGLEIYGKSIPAELVGGDFYEYFEFEEGSFGVSIGDASGHGIPAALLVRDVVIGLRMGIASEYKTVYTLKKLNKVIQQSTYSSNFVSLFIGELEKSGHLFYVNAGHPSPFVVSGDRVQELRPTGLILGFLEDIKLQRSHIYLEKNSVLVLYTDGLVERTNSNEEQYGEERLQELVIENQHKNPQKIIDAIYASAHAFGNSGNWDDDVTIVVIKRK